MNIVIRDTPRREAILLHVNPSDDKYSSCSFWTWKGGRPLEPLCDGSTRYDIDWPVSVGTANKVSR